MPTPRLLVVVGSTRPGRAGLAVGQWFRDVAHARGDLEVELADLAEVALPLLDEPHQAVERRYAHDHTRRWSEVVERADAFAFVTPEYNHSYNAATKNAIDYLYHEWRFKPFAIVSYGGQSRGLRASVALRTVLTGLAMASAGDVAVSLNERPVVDGIFEPTEAVAAAATRVLDQLSVLAPLYQALRD
ncbi:MAG TPA: NAD(P)H-dependent oxidoreductase [Acidimicrobiales bacterium]|nr:MAG: NADPH-dependent FMN reductase [Actinobacteria bacterium 21-73-9]HQU26129.1 NAD(P)H-dependent oxidoreductase [Acidimicrobiales bacterium]